MTDIIIPVASPIDVLVDSFEEDITTKFRRLWLADPILRAMDEGRILWGDIMMTKEETDFHHQWAQKMSEGATAPLTPTEERPETPTFVPFEHPLEAGVQLEAGLRPTSVWRDEESGQWEMVKPKTLLPPVVVGIKTLITRNLPRDVTVEALRAIFERFGPVKDVYIPRNMDRASPYFGTIKGLALIKFLKPTYSAKAFTQLYGKLTLGSHNISLEFAKEDR